MICREFLLAHAWVLIVDDSLLFAWRTTGVNQQRQANEPTISIKHCSDQCQSHSCSLEETLNRKQMSMSHTEQSYDVAIPFRQEMSLTFVGMMNFFSLSCSAGPGQLRVVFSSFSWPFVNGRQRARCTPVIIFHRSTQMIHGLREILVTCCRPPSSISFSTPCRWLTSSISS